MIINNITASGFRTFRNEISVPADESFSEDVNIIHGPNETGKSSLLLALVRGLFDYHKTTASDVEADRPWGTELSPKISVTFTADGDTYRIEKRFLRGQKSDLFRKEGGTFKRWRDEKAANQFVRNLFNAEAPSGGTGPKHWGLIRALWLRQGRGRYEDPDFSDVSEQIAGDPGSVALSEFGEQLLADVNEEYDAYYTSGGKFTTASGAPLAEVADELRDLLEEQRELQEQKDELEEKRDRFENLKKELETADAAIEELNEEIETLEEKVEESAEIQQSIEEKEEKKGRLENRLEDLEKDRDKWKEVIEERKKLVKKRNKRQDQLDAISEELDDIEENISDVEEKRQEARSEREDARNRVRELEKTAGLAELREKVQENENRLKDVEGWNERIEENEDELEDRRIPEKSDLKDAEELQDTITGKTSRLETVGLTVEVEADEEWEITLTDDGGDTEELRVPAGDAETRNFDKQVEVEVPGSGSIHVTSGAEEIERIRRELEDVREEFHDLLDRFSSEDLEDLRDWFTRARETQQEIENLQDRIQDRLGSDHDSIAEVRETLSEQRSKQERLLEELDLNEDEIPGEVPELEPAREDLEETQEKIEDLQEKQNELKEERKELREEKSDLRERESGLSADISNRENRREEFIDEHGPLEDLENKIDALREEREEFEDEISDLREELPDEAEDLEDRLEDKQQSLNRKKEEKKEKQSEVDKLEGKMEDLREKGVTSRLNEVREKIQITYRKLADHLGRARGARLLKTIIETRRDRAVRDLVQPVEQRVNRYFQHITGEEDRTVRVDETFGPDQLQSGEFSASFDELMDWALSSGTTEQLHLALRTAVAREMAGDQPRPLFIDDALGNTDPDRLKRIKDLIRRESDHLQVFILTCAPDRYRDLTGKWIDLKSLKT